MVVGWFQDQLLTKTYSASFTNKKHTGMLSAKITYPPKTWSFQYSLFLPQSWKWEWDVSKMSFPYNGVTWGYFHPFSTSMIMGGRVNWNQTSHVFWKMLHPILSLKMNHMEAEAIIMNTSNVRFISGSFLDGIWIVEPWPCCWQVPHHHDELLHQSWPQWPGIWQASVATECRHLRFTHSANFNWIDV